MGRALLVLATLAPYSARAQGFRDGYEERARSALQDEPQAGLRDAEARAELAGQLQLTAVVLLGVGVAALLGTSIGTFLCEEDCAAVHGVFAVGSGLAATGLGFLVAGTLMANDAQADRRRWMREHLGLAPRLVLGLRGSF